LIIKGTTHVDDDFERRVDSHQPYTIKRRLNGGVNAAVHHSGEVLVAQNKKIHERIQFKFALPDTCFNVHTSDLGIGRSHHNPSLMFGNRRSFDQGLGELPLNWKALAYGSRRMLCAWRLIVPRLLKCIKMGLVLA
jgi:hypothetical protein